MDLGKFAKQKSTEFDKLYIFGTGSNKFILRLDLKTHEWDKLDVPEGLKLWDYSVAVTLPNGKIFLSGGINSALTEITKCAFIVDMREDAPLPVEVLPNMSHGRYTHTATYLNNYIYVIGGRYYGNG